MKSILKTLLAFTIVLSLNSCSSDDDAKKTTNATITVTNGSGPVSGMTVYVYSETTWNVIGDDPFFAEGEVSTDDQGKAFFSNLEYPTTFNEINNYQNNMRFSVHYVLNGVEKTKVTAITLKQGDSKTGTLNLN